MEDLDDLKPLRNMSEALKELAATLDSPTADVELAPFSRSCFLFLPLIRSWGIAFKFAELDFLGKVKDLAVASKSIGTLQAMVDGDIEANTVRKDTSHTKNLLRLTRGLDMIRVFFEQLLATEGNSIRDPAFKAYTQVFAPHHGWAVRKVVAAGTYALPTRAQMLKKLNEDEASARAPMQSFVDASAPVIQHIERLFHSRDLFHVLNYE
ncbi:Pleckstrin homology domain-containing family A member 8 [Morella rubra]|uniref:Pleckstrin homology domain-containing family A member 8 n=1 Tax=Morella rubra TaxID=262757 RepID=A0A6A1UKP2_9ROSI|nr:Pleckstrin homology domain-containing family A member 8 [Morella rubra]KAB1200975.1 Pleckstrin homology domain-containing family A member 8 [Morella rubra]